MVTWHDPSEHVLEDELSDCIVDWVGCVVVELDDSGDSDGVGRTLAAHRTAAGTIPGRVLSLLLP